MDWSAFFHYLFFKLIPYTSPADGRLTYQSDRHACICCCHISRLRQRSDISDSHSFARRCRSFKTGSLLIPGQALGRWEGVVYKKRAVHWHCSLFVISGFLSSQGASPQVLSAFAGLTAVFGMGTGVSPRLSSLNSEYSQLKIEYLYCIKKPNRCQYVSVTFFG